MFFFFKQKTAYEMSIGDWSSDVCSSDLCCTSAQPGCCRTGRRRHGSSRTHAPFFFELFHQSSNLENGQATELVHQFICICHFLFLGSPPPKAFGELRPTAIGPDSFASLPIPPPREENFLCRRLCGRTLLL